MAARYRFRESAWGPPEFPAAGDDFHIEFACGSCRALSARILLATHGLIERDGKLYACQLSGKGTKVTFTFVLFHQRLCGPLASSLFHHQPNNEARPNSKMEAVYHKADSSMRNVIQLLEQLEIC